MYFSMHFQIYVTLKVASKKQETMVPSVNLMKIVTQNEFFYQTMNFKSDNFFEFR